MCDMYEGADNQARFMRLVANAIYFVAVAAALAIALVTVVVALAVGVG